MHELSVLNFEIEGIMYIVLWCFQIYWLLAEKGELDTPKDVKMRVTNLTKALDAITVAMARLSDDDDPVRLKLMIVTTQWTLIIYF